MGRPDVAAAPLLSWSRTGGRPPADDERLEIHDDGRFRARRTVGGTRIGSFEGTLPAGAADDLRRLSAAGRQAGELWLETPRDGATETVTLGADEGPLASVGSNARPDGPWAALIARLRGLADDVTAHPAAALELVADPSGARLVAAGPGSLGVDAASVAVRVVRLDAAGALLGRWQAADAAPTPGWTPTAPGWSLDLPFDHGLELERTDWLQVWVFLRLRDANGEPRAGRLFEAVPGDARRDDDR